MVGLGGGSLAKFCHHHLPQTRITVLEIDPDVIALRRAFAVPDDPRLAIIEADAAVYLPDAPADVDVLLLDGYDPVGISPSFLHQDFYRAARACLRPGGMVVANLAGPESAWAVHRTLLELEFEQVLMLATADADNHVAFAFIHELEADEWTRLKQPATALARRVPLDFLLLLKCLRRTATRKNRGLSSNSL